MRDKKEVELWVRRINEGLAYREQDGGDKDWKVAYECYRNQYPAGMETENLVYSIGTQMVEEATPENPRIVLTAFEPENIAAALVLQQVLNQLFVLMQLEMELEDCTLDSFLYGVSVLKCGYDSVFGYDPAKEQPFGGTLTQFDKSGKRIEFFPRTAPGMPWCQRLAPWNLVVPDQTVVLEDAPWIAVRQVRFLEDAKADEKYERSARLQLKPSKCDPVVRGIEEAVVEMSDAGGSRRTDEKVALWEIWNRRGGERVVIAEDNEDLILMKKPDVMLKVLDGYPLVGQTANRNGRCFWGDGDYAQMKGGQHTLNSLLTQLNEHARAGVVRHILNQDMIEPDDIKALTSGIPNAIIRTAKKLQPGTKLDDVIKSWNPEFPGQLLPAMDVVRAGVRQTLGYSRLSLAEQAGSPQIRTAREVDVVAMAHAIRAGRRGKLNRRMVLQLARKLARMVFAFWTNRQVVQVVGAKGAPVWVQFTGQELRAEYLFEYAAEDKVQATTEQRKTEALALLQALPLLAQVGMNTEYLLRGILKYFPEFDPAQALARPQPQEAIGLQELQGQLGGGNANLPVQM